jgi:hypothetical protein
MPAIKPSIVRINGVDVGTVKRGSLYVEVGDGSAPSEGATQVTLTLYARRVEIKAEVVDEELGDTSGAAEV